MYRIRRIDGSDPLLQTSRLLVATQRTITYLDEHGSIGLTQSKAFNRKFTTWAAENFNWPAYSKDRLLRIQKVLNEDDVPPVMVIHDLLMLTKMGRHHRGGFRLTRMGKEAAADSGALFELIADTYLFRYNHGRLSRFDFEAPGNWDALLNVLNVEARDGVSVDSLVEVFYGLKKQSGGVDSAFWQHSSFLFSHVLRPLTWIGFLAGVQEDDSLGAERIYAKTPLWSKALALSTDEEAKLRILH